MHDLKESCGDDLIYSLAYENGRLFMCVTAHHTLTQKTFEDGMRVVFEIKEDELDIPQTEMISALSQLINERLINEVE